MTCKNVEFINSGTFPDNSTWTILKTDDKFCIFWKIHRRLTTMLFDSVDEAIMKIQNLFAEIYEGIF